MIGVLARDDLGEQPGPGSPFSIGWGGLPATANRNRDRPTNRNTNNGLRPSSTSRRTVRSRPPRPNPPASSSAPPDMPNCEVQVAAPRRPDPDRPGPMRLRRRAQAPRLHVPARPAPSLRRPRRCRSRRPGGSTSTVAILRAAHARPHHRPDAGPDRRRQARPGIDHGGQIGVTGSRAGLILGSVWEWDETAGVGSCGWRGIGR